MARIKVSNKTGVVAVLEDPRPTSNEIYLFGDQYNKSTLAPVFDKHLLSTTNASPWNNIGRNDASDTEISGGRPGYGIALTKQTSAVLHTTVTGNDTRTNVDISFGLSMNPAYPFSRIQHWTDGTTDMVTWYGHANTWFWNYANWSSIGDSKQLSDVNASVSGEITSVGDERYPEPARTINGWFYRDPSSNYISGLGHYSYGTLRGTTQRMNPHFVYTRLDSFPNFSTHTWVGGHDGYLSQFIGPSELDGQPLYLWNLRTTDYNQYVQKHNVAANTVTTLHTFNTAPSASGSNYGGARSQSTGLKSQSKVSSQIFDDPTSAGNVCWYTPYFDTSNNYFPFFYQWDKSTDTFTRNADVTVSGDLSSTHLMNLHGCQGGYSGLKSILYNETFVVGGTRYVSLFPLDGGFKVNDTTETARTIVTYSVDASNPKALTFHSAVTVPATICNIVWLNDARTQFGAICNSAFHMYTFDGSLGYVKTASLPYQFWGVGRDSNDKIYAVAYNPGGYFDVHTIDQTIPINVVITPASATYDYQGSVISSTVAISAYNANGARIATTLNLAIEGSTMTFGDDSVATTVNTSSSADVTQAIKIIGAGFSNIVASVQV